MDKSVCVNPCKLTIQVSWLKLFSFLTEFVDEMKLANSLQL